MTNRPFKAGASREQACLLPPRVEDYVGPDHPVRVIEAYVCALDLAKLGFRHAERGVGVGQPPYDPGDLLKLYLYGYLNRVRSSRRLELEACRNLELIWLLKGLTPGYRTIGNFRKENWTALKAVNRSFVLLVAACPGCGRTTYDTFQVLARDIQRFIHTSMPEWKKRYPGVEALNVAVMGCIVNGPGESKHADIGISLPGTGESPAAPVFIDGKKAVTLRGPTVAADFKQMVIDYIDRRFGHGGAGRSAAE